MKCNLMLTDVEKQTLEKLAVNHRDIRTRAAVLVLMGSGLGYARQASASRSRSSCALADSGRGGFCCSPSRQRSRLPRGLLHTAKPNTHTRRSVLGAPAFRPNELIDTTHPAASKARMWSDPSTACSSKAMPDQP